MELGLLDNYLTNTPASNEQFDTSFEEANSTMLMQALESNTLVHRVTAIANMTSELADGTAYVATPAPIFQGILINTGAAQISTGSYL